MTGTLYLSRVRLRPSASVGALLPLLLGDGGSDNGQSWHPGHHLIWSLFAAEPAMRRDFLWRGDGTRWRLSDPVGAPARGPA